MITIKKVIITAFCFVFLDGIVFSDYSQMINHSKNKKRTQWFNLMLNGKKAGYFSFSQQIETQGGNKFVVWKEEMFMKINRSHNVISINTNSFKKMDMKGRLVQFKYRSIQGDSSYDIKGDFDYEQGIINTIHSRNGHEKVQKLSIKSNAMTEYQALLLLKKRGWVEGDSVSYSNLMVEKGTYINVEMKLEKILKKSYNDDKSKNLYKVVRTIENIPGIKSVTWIDSELDPHRGELIFPHIKYTLEPTKREKALQLTKETIAFLNLARLHLKNFNSLCSEDRRKKIKKITLLLKLKEGKPFDHNLDGGVQKINNGNLTEGILLNIDTNIPERTRQITNLSKTATLSRFLKSNSYIESDDQKIIDLSGEFTVKGSDWKTALNVRDWVHSNILMKFDTGFASASEVLKTRMGDCTEHAVLTAALCRACGIPTRVALGYNLSFENDENPIYIGHMWNEVFINGTWIPIDSTSSSDTINPFLVRFFFSSLEINEIMKKMALFALTQNLEISLVSIN